VLTLIFDTGHMNISSITATLGGGSAPPPSPSSSAFGGSPRTVPGVIEAEDFDDGGEGVAYYDTTNGNAGGSYRSGDVDIEAASEGGYDVGWTAAGEWLNYTVNVASPGSYDVQLRVASPYGGSIHVGFNGASGVSNAVTVPPTGGWQSWTTV